jgi:integrase
MSYYLVKGKGWRYGFTLNGQRYTEAWFRTKKEAIQAEVRKREELAKPKPAASDIPTDMDFLELVNLRLDHVKAYNSERHYAEYRYMAKRWLKCWGLLTCSQISQKQLEDFILGRGSVSSFTANKEIRYLRSLFNYGKKKRLLGFNPLDGVDFLPVEKRVKYVPPVEDIDKVIDQASSDVQDYLWAIRETMARVSEINRLTWDDVDLKARVVILYTRKKKGGHLTPRRVPMTLKLYGILSRRYQEREPDKPWVFWHRYWSRNENAWKEGQFNSRKKFMITLCRKAGVKYFRFHAMRHARAFLLEQSNVPIGTIQRILGHENRSTTEIYLHSIGDSERSAMLIYEQARQQSHTDSHTQQKSL